jgi:hypothetical protein
LPLHPIRTIRMQREVEMPHDLCENQAHLSIREAISES